MTDVNEQLNPPEITNEEEILEELDDSTITEVEKVNVVEGKKFDTKSIECGDFINKHLVPCKSIKCIVPIELLESIRKIEKSVNRKFGSSKEFSIFIHGDYDLDGNLIVSNNFYIPRQNVGAATVDYLEDPEEYYNGCLHKHPDGCKNFSGTDEKYINSNFDFSLLYVCLNITKGIINIPYDGKHRIQCSVNIELQSSNEDDIDIQNILQKENNCKVIQPTTCTTPNLVLPGFNSMCTDGLNMDPKGEVILPHIARESSIDTDMDEWDNDISRDPEQIEFFNKLGI